MELPTFEIVSRDVATAENRTRYFTGYPCKRGHLAERYTSTGGCTACVCRKLVKLPRQDNIYLDGVPYLFPYGTDPAVIQRVMRRLHEREFLIDMVVLVESGG